MNPIIAKTHIEGNYLITREIHKDDRGSIKELFVRGSLGTDSVEQINYTFSKKGVLRGLHKSPYSKTISCVSGKIFDVCLDTRKYSTTFLKYYCTVLDSKNNQQFIIPSGCAHGFVALEDSCVVYAQDGKWNPELETNLRWDEFNIEWPHRIGLIWERWIGVKRYDFILSEKDKNALTKAEFLKTI